MATEFFRLYRELGKVDIKGPPPDIGYVKEKKFVLGAMGHDVGSIREPTKAPKFHGRVARRRMKEKLENAVAVDKRLDQKRANELLEITTQNNEIRQLLSSLENTHASRITDVFWTQFETLFPGEEEPAVKSNIHDNAAAVTTSDRRPTKREPTLARSESFIRKDYSLNKWTTEERNRLNALYWEVNKPLVSDKAAWRDYYIDIASRYRVFFPRRTTKEIIVKVRELIAHRVLKERGEKEFWKEIKSSP